MCAFLKSRISFLCSPMLGRTAMGPFKLRDKDRSLLPWPWAQRGLWSFWEIQEQLVAYQRVDTPGAGLLFPA